MTPESPDRHRLRIRGSARTLFVSAAVPMALLVLAGSAHALPDNRVYELVTPVEKNGVNRIGPAVSAADGNAVDWTALGGLGEATSGSVNLYRSRRKSNGWQTTSLTPTPTPDQPLGFLQEEAAVFWTADLSRTIFTTPEPLAPGDRDAGALDLYMEEPEGELTWTSQGTQGGSAPLAVTFDGATRDGDSVVFNTAEPLLAGEEEIAVNAAAHLYVREISAGVTHLVNAGSNGAPLNSEGAILGNGNDLTEGKPPATQFQAADQEGTTTNAISNDGSKIFFESPAPSPGEAALGAVGGRRVHLYMRKDNSTTVMLDGSPATAGGARYMGASEDGSKVFFLSNEGLAGSFADSELYEYDTKTEALTPISRAAGQGGPIDGAVNGVSAISNDGSRIYYVAQGLLAGNANARGAFAKEGEPNLYLYDTITGSSTFIALLSAADAGSSLESSGPLDSPLDIHRHAVPSPDGSVLVFQSSADLTGQNSTGFSEIYRYDAGTGALDCLSCPPPGVVPSGDATLGEAGGGSYAPADLPTPMSADGARVFFQSPDPLVAADINNGTAIAPSLGLPVATDVYEWHDGAVALISEGRSSTPSRLDGTSPSGGDVFFTTAASMVPEDTDGGDFDIYDARIAGGLSPPAATPSSSCAGPGCRGQVSTPAVFGGLASMLPQDSGNARPATPKARHKTLRRKSKQHRRKRRRHKAKRIGRRGRTHAERS